MKIWRDICRRNLLRIFLWLKLKSQHLSYFCKCYSSIFGSYLKLLYSWLKNIFLSRENSKNEKLNFVHIQDFVLRNKQALHKYFNHCHFFFKFLFQRSSELSSVLMKPISISASSSSSAVSSSSSRASSKFNQMRPHFDSFRLVNTKAGQNWFFFEITVKYSSLHCHSFDVPSSSSRNLRHVMLVPRLLRRKVPPWQINRDLMDFKIKFHRRHFSHWSPLSD